jgi:hypothetical protein
VKLSAVNVTNVKATVDESFDGILYTGKTLMQSINLRLVATGLTRVKAQLEKESKYQVSLKSECS